MSPSEIVIAVLGLVVGYWVVSNLIRSKAPPPPAATAPWHQVLAVAPTATPEEIKLAYRTLMNQYHPDKVASLGVELQALAEAKSKEISAAYREGLEARGVEP